MSTARSSYNAVSRGFDPEGSTAADMSPVNLTTEGYRQVCNGSVTSITLRIGTAKTGSSLPDIVGPDARRVVFMATSSRILVAHPNTGLLRLTKLGLAPAGLGQTDRGPEPKGGLAQRNPPSVRNRAAEYAFG